MITVMISQDPVKTRSNCLHWTNDTRIMIEGRIQLGSKPGLPLRTEPSLFLLVTPRIQYRITDNS